MRDGFCGNCAYRVNERVIRDASIAYELFCLHPAVHKEPCRDARDERGACGPDAIQFVKRAQQSKGEAA